MVDVRTDGLIMVKPGPDPDNYPPIDPAEPVPDDAGELLPDTPETLPPAPVSPVTLVTPEPAITSTPPATQPLAPNQPPTIQDKESQLIEALPPLTQSCEVAKDAMRPRHLFKCQRTGTTPGRFFYA